MDDAPSEVLHAIVERLHADSDPITSSPWEYLDRVAAVSRALRCVAMSPERWAAYRGPHLDNLLRRFLVPNFLIPMTLDSECFRSQDPQTFSPFIPNF